MKTTKIIVFSILTLVIVFFVYKRVDNFFAIDACLDSGGSWNYEEKKCEYEKIEIVTGTEPVIETESDSNSESESESESETEEKTIIDKSKSYKNTEIPEITGQDSISQHSRILLDYFLKALNSTGNEKLENDSLFFKDFPSTFKQMQDFYGYDAKNGAAPLYDYPIGHDQILYFSNLNTIPEKEYYRKYVSICINGIWQADNIREAFYFGNKLKTETKVACAYLSERPEKEIISVFKFIFDGPHPDNYQDDYEELSEIIKTEDSKLADLLKKSYDQLLSESDGHGH